MTVVRGQPKYQKIRDDLEEQIINGTYKKGEYIPSETKLCEYYDVSRTTVRDAIKELITDGYLVIKRGKGTKVTSSKLKNNIPNSLSFTDIINAKNLKPSTLEMNIKKIKPNKQVCKKLNLNQNDEVFKFSRIRAVDDEPIAINVSYVLVNYLDVFDVNALKGSHSFYQILRDNYNIMIESAIDNISAINADSLTAKKLKVDKGDPILFIERLALDQQNNPIEYSEVYYRGDRYSHAVIINKN